MRRVSPRTSSEVRPNPPATAKVRPSPCAMAKCLLNYQARQVITVHNTGLQRSESTSLVNAGSKGRCT